MFTGIVEHTARVAEIQLPNDRSGCIVTLDESGPILDDCHIGDSICVNGTCLTVTVFDAKEGWFQVGLAPETLSRTNLGKLVKGDKVNCERAMSGHTRFGGHMVQGHVDTTATITSKTPDGDSIRYNFKLTNPSQIPYIIEKGYVTVDGASLTVTEVNESGTGTGEDAEAGFGIMLISHSQSVLTLTQKEVGDTVNIEVDVVGKYVLGSTSRLEAMVERIVDQRLKALGH